MSTNQWRYLGTNLEINDIHFRSFAGESDFHKMIEVHSACRVADEIDYVLNLKDLKLEAKHPVNFDPKSDMIFVEKGSKVIAYGHVKWRQEEPSMDRIYFNRIFVHPDWRSKGVDQAVLAHNEARIREIAKNHPQDGDCYFQMACNDKAEAMISLVKQAGYRPERYFFDMVRPNLEDIPELPMPEGLEVRQIKLEDYRKVWNADVEAFRDHWGYCTPEEDDYQEWLKWQYFKPELFQVAWDGEEVAGQVLNFIDHQENEVFGRLRGYTEDISVRRPWRRRGLASALIARSLKVMKGQGMQEAALGVDSENSSGALNLYKRLGFEVVKRNTVYRKKF